MANPKVPASILAASLDTAHVEVWNRVKALSEREIYDPLTRLYNARHLAITFHMEHSRARRFGRQLSVILLDIDQLGDIRDTAGDDVAKRVFVDVARFVAERPRDYDLVFRLDKDGFLILLPETGSDGVRHVAEDLVESVVAESFAGLEPGVVTISAGYTEVRTDDKMEGLDPVMERVHGARTQAHTTGGNAAVEF